MSDIKQVDLQTLVDKIQERCRANPKAYSLILGSGFSSPVIPSTKELIPDILWWSYCARHNLDFAEHRAPEDSDAFRAFCAAIWEKFGSAPNLEETNLVSKAYIFLNSIDGPLDEPSKRCRFMRAVCDRAGLKVNDAHLYLASLIKLCPNFAGNIFTTNFDPLLQRSLQLFNTLYRVVDSPDWLQVGDDVPAVQLVYVHGSIYTYLLTDPKGMATYVQEFSQGLGTKLRERGVIVIGYGGWENDLVMASLASNQAPFQGNLYWCDILDDPNNLRDPVRAFLTHPNAYYVNLGRQGAVGLLAKLHRSLTAQPCPTLMLDPLEFLISDLENVEITDLADSPEFNLSEKRSNALRRLRAATEIWNKVVEEGGVVGGESEAVTTGRVAALVAEAERAFAEDRFQHAVDLFRDALRNASDPSQIAITRLQLGLALEENLQKHDALQEYENVAMIPEVDEVIKARALGRKGRLLAEARSIPSLVEAEEALSSALSLNLADSNRVGDLLLRRAQVRLDLRRYVESIEDLDKVIAIDGVRGWRKARATRLRGELLGELGRVDEALRDLRSVDLMAEAEKEDRELALLRIDALSKPKEDEAL